MLISTLDFHTDAFYPLRVREHCFICLGFVRSLISTLATLNTILIFRWLFEAVCMRIRYSHAFHGVKASAAVVYQSCNRRCELKTHKRRLETMMNKSVGSPRRQCRQSRSQSDCVWVLGDNRFYSVNKSNIAINYTVNMRGTIKFQPIKKGL